jgi:hypothetical protein
MKNAGISNTYNFQGSPIICRNLGMKICRNLYRYIGGVRIRGYKCKNRGFEDGECGPLFLGFF